MKILAFETSCDETGIALVEGTKTPEGFTFVTHKAMLLSQAALHAEYGGVYPTLAKREHEKNLPVLYREFADLEFDAVAVTYGPGLEPALWQGVEFVKRVARERGVPLLPVNHMEAHLLSSLAKGENTKHEIRNTKLPVLALLISGGHTEFVLMKEWFDYQIIGQTLDDAVGECFDKVARMLGLTYPGGPEIGKLAALHRGREKLVDKESGPIELPEEGVAIRETRGLLASNFSLPRPMLQSGTCDFSFSGLKTAALYKLRDAGGIQKLSADEITQFAAEFEDAVGDVMVSKATRALEQTGAQTFVIGGGVAASTYLRERLGQLTTNEFPNVEFRLPDLKLTGDNAVMIGMCALARALSGVDDKKNADEVRAVGNLRLSN